MIFLGLIEKIEENKVVASNFADVLQHTFQSQNFILIYKFLNLYIHKKKKIIKMCVDWILGSIPQTQEVGSYLLGRLTWQTKLKATKNKHSAHQRLRLAGHLQQH